MVTARTTTALLERAPASGTSKPAHSEAVWRRIDYHGVEIYGERDSRESVGSLPKGTPVQVTGRSMDRRLIEIMTEAGLRAWVDAISLNKAPVEKDESPPATAIIDAGNQCRDISTEAAAPSAPGPAVSEVRSTEPVLTPSDLVLLDALAPMAGQNAIARAIVTAILACEEAGTIQLEAVGEDRFFRLLTIDRTWMRRTDSERTWPRESLEAAMTATGRVEDVVYRWLGGDSHNPERDAVDRLKASHVRRRVLIEGIRERRFLKFFALRSKTYTVSQTYAEASLRGELPGSVLRRCERERPGLYTLLSREVRNAFSRRRLTYDNWD